MRFYKPAVFAIVAFTLGSVPARAQNAPAVAITPFVSIGTDNSSPIGAAVSFPISSLFSVETDVTYRRAGRLNLPSANTSILFSLPRIGRVTPYAAAGVGLARYGTVETFRTAETVEPTLGVTSRLTTTVNFGGGIKTQLTDRMDFRTDLRWIQSPETRANADQFWASFGVGINLGKR